MSITVKTFVVRDTATPGLNAILQGVQNSRPLMGIIGRRLVNDLRKHFLAKESEPSKRPGWPKGHLWSRIAKGTAIRQFDEKSVSVGIGGGAEGPIFLKRLNGGTIRPKEKRALAIPINPMAAGKYPSQNAIPGVFMTRREVGGRMQSFLAINESGFPTDVGPEGQVLLWVLKKSVQHPKDPTALPPDEKLLAGINDEVGKFVDRQARRAAK